MNRSRAPEWLVFNPYISAGYRKQLGVFDCVKSIFSLHNETGNMWTHLLASVYTLYYINYAYSRLDGQPELDKTIYLLTGFAAFLCFFLSFVYHTFGCYSSRAFDVLLHFDYAGIISLQCSMTLSSIYFGFCCHQGIGLFHMTASFILGLYIAGLVVLPIILPPSARMQKFVEKYWTMSFAIFFFEGMIPLIHWGLLYGFSHDFFTRVLSSFLLLGIGSVIYLFQIPERWLIGMCDYFLSSHQLWHLFTFWGALRQIENGLDWATGGYCRACQAQ